AEWADGVVDAGKAKRCVLDGDSLAVQEAPFARTDASAGSLRHGRHVQVDIVLLQRLTHRRSASEQRARVGRRLRQPEFHLIVLPHPRRAWSLPDRHQAGFQSSRTREDVLWIDRRAAASAAATAAPARIRGRKRNAQLLPQTLEVLVERIEL